MPTYQYRCPTCGHEFEEFQAISDEAISVCPACQGKTHRVITGGVGLIFKGTGFYITDYKKKSGGDGSGKERTETKSEKTAARSESSATKSESSSSRSESSSAKSETGSSKLPDSKAKPAAPSKD
ncbi:MAG: FmdB family zinc ribbon protein [Candidatus Zixiibacteriota bacterium]